MIGRHVKRLEIIVIGFYFRTVVNNIAVADKIVRQAFSYLIERVPRTYGMHRLVYRQIQILRSERVLYRELVQLFLLLVAHSYKLDAQIVDLFSRLRFFLGRQIFERSH